MELNNENIFNYLEFFKVEITILKTTSMGF